MELNNLITHLYENAPGFASRMQAAQLSPEDVNTDKDLNALPVIRKDDLVAIQASDPPFGGYLACQPGELKRVFQSPGPIYEPESRTPDYWRWQEALSAAGFHPGDRVLNAFSYHLTPAGAMFEEGLWAVGCAVIPAGVGNQEQQVQVLQTLQVNGYVGLPSYLKALLDKAEGLGLELSLDKAFVTAEPLPDSLRAELNARGITVRQGYGTAECGNMGYECEQEKGWHIPQSLILQVCEIDTGEPLPDGETGEIVATLYNPDYALVRFGTGDLSSVNPEPCPCGRKTPRLEGWQGRVGSAVKVRGIFLHPHQLAGVLGRFPEVQDYQAVITRTAHRDNLQIKIVVAPKVEQAPLIERVQNAAQQALKLRLEVAPISEQDLSPEAPKVLDQRSWD
jgi:phenylacetate-CoA ligase